MESPLLAATVVLLSLLALSDSQQVKTTFPLTYTVLELQKEVSRPAVLMRNGSVCKL